MTVTTSPFFLKHTFPYTGRVKKKVQGIFHENPECNQLPQLNQNQKKKSDKKTYIYLFFAILLQEISVVFIHKNLSISLKQ